MTDLNPISDIAPYSIEAEMAVLGCCLLSPRSHRDLCRMLTPEDFYRPAHRVIFAAMQRLEATGKPCDQITLETALRDSGNLGNVGGPDYVLEVAFYVSSSANADAYGQIVRDKSQSRRLISACQKAKNLLAEGDIGAAREFMQSALKTLHSSVIGFEDGCDVDESGEDVGVPTGFPSIDKAVSTGGWPSGQMSVVVACQKTGKSAALLQAMIAACEQDLRVCYATFGDLSKVRIKRRLLRMLSGFSNLEGATRFEEKYGVLGSIDAFKEAKNKVDYDWSWKVRDASKIPAGRDVDDFIASIESHQEGPTPFGIIFVDYAQKLTTQHTNATQQVAIGDYCSDAISSCAERIGIPIVVGSQVTEGNAKQGTTMMTKGSRKWLEDCGLSLLISKGEGLERRIDIPYSRFGGDGFWRPYRFDLEKVRFVEQGA